MFTIMKQQCFQNTKTEENQVHKHHIPIWFQKRFEWLNFFIFMNRDSDMEIINR